MNGLSAEIVTVLAVATVLVVGARRPARHHVTRRLARVAGPPRSGWMVGPVVARARWWVGGPRRFTELVEQSGLPVAAPVLWRAALAAAVTSVVVAALSGGPAAGVVVMVLVAGAVVMAVDLVRDRAGRLVDAALPDLVDSVAGSVRAGAPLSQSLREAAVVARGPLVADVRWLQSSVEAGVPLAETMVRWRGRRDTPGVRLVGAAMVLSAELGGHSRPLEGVASTLRDRLAIGRELRAASAQARASIAVMIGAPVAFLAFNAARDPGSVVFSFRQPLGLVCLAGGLLLDGVGAWWMVRLTRRLR